MLNNTSEAKGNPMTQAIDLGTLVTESENDSSTDLDLLDVQQAVEVMNNQDVTVAQSVSRQNPAIAAAIEAIVERMKTGGRLIYIGAGTSGRLGILDAAECRPTFSVPEGVVIGIIAGGERAVQYAVEGAEDSPESAVADLKRIDLSARDAVVGITASGRTPYVAGALTYTKEVGALAIAVSCNSPALVSSLADHPIEVVTGPEVLTGSTRLKAATAQKMVLNMISTITMVKLGKTYGNLMVDLSITNEKLRERALRMIQRIAGLSRDRAEAALMHANGELKVALVMAMSGVDAASASARLAQANGHLRQALK